MRRAMTMVETLLAVGLLSALTVAMASWLQVSVRTASGGTDPARWRDAATAVLQLIHEDWVIGDVSIKRTVDRVGIERGALTIRTRGMDEGEQRGPVDRRYRHDPVAMTLLRETAADGTSWRQTRFLLDKVATWETEIDNDRDVLTVTAISDTGETVTRSYRLQ